MRCVHGVRMDKDCPDCEHKHGRVTPTLRDVNPPSLEAEALGLLRELNDALVIPSWLQPRVDALLDRAEEKS